ncbi:MAG: hybrid sensor histidine kinase/response regulator [Aequorivita sp.]|jgi:signal transduction histidine kinase/CheY-like chemotaxis protein/HPt (histidine-containing phosphotransfer) domain-containing protein/CHASE3 domain sensor protein|nr:hybrid sensor histidine kinase/response regulator [Aequorivita sp.]MBP40586.1 hybrid sensor histidine kinase/response regulator [Aequorivita sp.]|tara:strand:- start:6140 stop:8605 length:2466 start_codon:yes stop_codon:yes gene_type:complete
MATSKNKFTFKIILSYLVLGALAVLVGFFLYSEFKNFTAESSETTGEKKFIETGTLINLVYETDGFSRLALLTESDEDFEKYMAKTDSLFRKIDEIKSLTTNDFQIKQLDSVKTLLKEKNRNIEQLRILRLTNQKDTSLDDIMREVRKLEASVGLNSVESLIKNPSKLNTRERKIWQNYADYLNSDATRDTSTVKSKTVDSMLTAARYIVSEAKKENSRIRESLIQKENELIRNDLNISERLREIIASFDREITKNNNLEKQQRAKSMERTKEILKFAGILGGIVVLLFSYFILSDFFRAERFKKNLEESKNYAESLLKSREQLISTVSHDLKTPLNTISGYSELFENSTLSEKQKYYLAQITSSSHFISHLVDDLLDFSKLEAGKLPIESVPFSLENIIIEAGNAVKQQFPQKAVDLKFSISQEIKSKIFESDPLRIRQIINNLVGNAFKFTENGSVEIKVEELEKFDKISKIKISVIDTGIGISEEKQQLIFNEFTQAETEIAHKFGGSGLGLAISKKLTELLGGSLKVESVLGEGSNFILILPLKNSDRILTKTIPKEHISFEGLKAVIIDDDESMRALLQEIFEQMEITSEAFESYEQLKTSNFGSRAESRPDFILTDIQMPKTDGFTVLEKLKNGEINSYKNQPVIAMTGSREHSRDFYLNKGFSEMLPKPFSKQELVAVLERIFPNRRNFSEEYIVDEIFKSNSADNGKFDLSLLKSFLNTPEALEGVLEVFNVQTEKDLQQIKNSIAENDTKTISEIAHRMLTMFRQIRAKEVIPILEKMEDYTAETVEPVEMKMDFEKLILNIRDLQNALSIR